METNQAPPQQPEETTSEASNTVEMKMEDLGTKSELALDLDPNDPALDRHERIAEQAAAAAATEYMILTTPDSPSVRSTASASTISSNRSQQEELNDRQHSRVHRVAAMTGQIDQELIRQKSLVEQVAAMTGKLDQLGKHNDEPDESSSCNEKEEKKDEKYVRLEPNQSQDLPLIDGISDGESLSANSSQHGHGYGMIYPTCSGLIHDAELAQEACQVSLPLSNGMMEEEPKSEHRHDHGMWNYLYMQVAELASEACQMSHPLSNGMMEEEPKPIAPGTLSFEGEGLRLQLLLEAERVEEELMTPPKLVKKSHGQLNWDISPDSVFNFDTAVRVSTSPTASNDNNHNVIKQEEAHDPFFQAICSSERYCDHSPEREPIHVKPVSSSSRKASSLSGVLHIDTTTDTCTSTPSSPSRLPSASTSPTRRSPPRPDPDAQESSLSSPSSARVADSTRYPSKLPSPKRSPAREKRSEDLDLSTPSEHATDSQVRLSASEEEEPPQEEVHSRDHIQQPENEEFSSTPSSIPPQAHIPTPSAVYIQDDVYGWLPAKMLEARATVAIVSLDLPSHWTDSTIISFGSGEQRQEGAPTFIHKSLKGLEIDDAPTIASDHKVSLRSLRAVPWKDYTEGVLPEQNSTKAKRDMVDLVQLHEAAILFNLKERHYQSQPYTRVGDILVAVNPYCWMDHLYTPFTQDEYTLKLIWQDLDKPTKDFLDFKNYYNRLGIEPHVYEVSSSAYRGLAFEQTDQTILVTGESGAGKTETVKILMAHLATIPQTRPQQDGTMDDAHSDVPMEIVSRVVSSSPVFEAFGNAKTLRNDNSSRFGKFTQLQFEMEDRSTVQQKGRSVPYTDLVGSHCTTYLLEKTRVVSHSPGERTYHIFYQLLAAPKEFKQELWLSFADCEADDFSYLADSGETSISGHSDATLWTETEEALQLFQFQGDSLKVLMRALVIVLQLGNLVFDDHDAKSEYEEHNTVITSQKELETLAQMTGIDAQVLESTMTCRFLKTGTEVVKVKASPQQSKEWCDALAKEIYSRIFDLMVTRINVYTSVDSYDKKRKRGHISLLDIFGFEKFQVNRFEQLLINYANEKLQNKYVIDNFKQIKEEYEAEGVDLYDLGLVDNSEILELLEGRTGLIDSLNEECHLPTGKNNESYVHKAKTNHRRSICFIDKKLHERTEFGIKHFAGSVVYNADQFVERNMDILPEGMVECAAKTSNSLIRAEFETTLQTLARERPSKRISVKKNRFVLEKFQTQLKSLMSALENSQTRYIRCIKPNTQSVPRKVDHACTMQQLQCSGLMTAIAISRETFPDKLSYEFILDRYACLMRARDFENIGKMKVREKVQHVLSQWLESISRKNRDGSRTMPFTCAKTKVFFKSGVQERLEGLRLEYFGIAAIVIQSMARRVRARNRYTNVHGKVVVFQRCFRTVMENNRFTKKKHSAIRLSVWMRGNLATQKVQGMRRERAATKIQSKYRSMAAIQRVETIRKDRAAVVCIQKAVQARRQRLHAASIIIQTAWRTHRTLTKNRAACNIQRVFRKYAIRRGPLAKRKPKLKSILRSSGKSPCSMSETSTSPYPSSLGSVTEMPPTPPSPKSGFMYFVERSWDCLICDCPGSSSVAAAVAE